MVTIDELKTIIKNEIPSANIELSADDEIVIRGYGMTPAFYRIKILNSEFVLNIQGTQTISSDKKLINIIRLLMNK